MDNKYNKYPLYSFTSLQALPSCLICLITSKLALVIINHACSGVPPLVNDIRLNTNCCVQYCYWRTMLPHVHHLDVWIVVIAFTLIHDRSKVVKAFDNLSECVFLYWICCSRLLSSFSIRSIFTITNTPYTTFTVKTCIYGILLLEFGTPQEVDE